VCVKLSLATSQQQQFCVSGGLVPQLLTRNVNQKRSRARSIQVGVDMADTLWKASQGSDNSHSVLARASQHTGFWKLQVGWQEQEGNLEFPKLWRTQAKASSIYRCLHILSPPLFDHSKVMRFADFALAVLAASRSTSAACCHAEDGDPWCYKRGVGWSSPPIQCP
jgi:hypothetical protein